MQGNAEGPHQGLLTLFLLLSNNVIRIITSPVRVIGFLISRIRSPLNLETLTKPATSLDINMALWHRRPYGTNMWVAGLRTGSVNLNGMKWESQSGLLSQGRYLSLSDALIRFDGADSSYKFVTDHIEMKHIIYTSY